MGLATAKQVSFISKLIDERNLLSSPRHWDATNAMDNAEYAAYLEHLKGHARTLSVSQASAWIDRLLELPLKSEPAALAAPQLPDVPAGRYAILDDDDVVKFYRVDRPTEGRWSGYTFLSAQASDELYPIKAIAKKVEVLTAIAQDPAEASRRYGQEIGSCGVCGRTLTDETSRAYGIGPVCRQQTGW